LVSRFSLTAELWTPVMNEDKRIATKATMQPIKIFFPILMKSVAAFEIGNHTLTHNEFKCRSRVLAITVTLCRHVVHTSHRQQPEVTTRRVVEYFLTNYRPRRLRRSVLSQSKWAENAQWPQTEVNKEIVCHQARLHRSQRLHCCSDLLTDAFTRCINRTHSLLSLTIGNSICCSLLSLCFPKTPM
jgi:hypothetical protein